MFLAPRTPLILPPVTVKAATNTPYATIANCTFEIVVSRPSTTPLIAMGSTDALNTETRPVKHTRISGNQLARSSASSALSVVTRTAGC